MCRVYPQKSLTPSYPFITSKKETFTIWMKSLVCNSYGCTVFDSKGEIVYRVENYDRKCSNEAFLMDLGGKVLFTVRKKKLQVFERWDGFRWSNGSDLYERRCFEVRKVCRMFNMRDFACQITCGVEKFWIVRNIKSGKAAFGIVDINGDTVAEAKRKVSSTGVLFGDDVLSLEVKPHIDHSFIMAIIIVYGLIRRKM